MTLNSRAALIEQTLAVLTDEPIEQTLKEQIHKLQLAPNEAQPLFDDVLLELQGYGPIEELFNDPNITEILIDSFADIFVEKVGVLSKSEKSFSNITTFDRFVKKLLSQMDKVADQRHPLVDGTLPNGCRVHVALPPITPNPIISIRKHAKSLWTLDRLIAAGSLSEAIAEKLRNSIKERKNILICGPTGAGKTTFLRALLADVEASERIVVVEDTEELKLERKNTVSLLARPSLEGLFPSICLSELLKNSLRMRPDRIVVGEIRSSEALVFLDATSTGHSGSMSSIHGNSSSQALGRLEQLASRAAPQWSVECIRSLVFEGIDIVICIERKNGSRQIHEISDVAGLESFGYLLNPWF